MRHFLRAVALLSIAVPWLSTRSATQDRPPPELLVRIDDLGMNHSVNLALEQLGQTGIAEQRSAFRAYLAGLTAGTLNLVVVHAAQATPEMWLVDMNNPTQNTATGEPLMSRHRQTELEMLLEFARGGDSRKVKLVTYADVITRLGRSSMRPPPE